MKNAARNEKRETLSDIDQKMKVLDEMRRALESGMRDLAATIAKTPGEQLATMRLYSLLTESANAGSADAVRAVVAAAGTNVQSVFGSPNGDLAEKIVRTIGYHFEKSDVTLNEARKPAGLTRLVIDCIKSTPNAAGSSSILKAVIAAEADTSDFINTAIQSELDFTQKMKAVRLAKTLNLFEDTMKTIEKSAVAFLTMNDHYLFSESGKETVATLMKVYAGDSLVEAVAAVQECENLSSLVRAIPDVFDLASKLVLEKGSPRALATFYRDHQPKCDKKAFHAKLADALKPDPEALAEAILEGRGGKYGMRGMHPMMFDIMMHGGPFGHPFVPRKF